MVYKHPYLLQNLPHHAGCVSGAGDEVDAAVVRWQAGYNVWKREEQTDWLLQDI